MKRKKLKLKRSVKECITISLLLITIIFLGTTGMKYRANQINSQQKMTESVAMNQSK